MSNRAKTFSTVCLGLGTATLLCCGGQSPTSDLPPLTDVRIELTVDGPTRDWDGILVLISSIQGEETGLWLGGLWNADAEDTSLPPGRYEIHVVNVAAPCMVDGPTSVDLAEGQDVVLRYDMHCGPLTDDPSPGRLALGDLLLDADGSSARTFLPETRTEGCSLILGSPLAAGQSLAARAEPLAAPPCGYLALDWCADGSRLAIHASLGVLEGGILMATGDGTGLERIDDGSLELVLSGPVVSMDRDCAAVAFAGARPEDDFGDLSVYTVSTDDGTPELVLEAAEEARWSPVDDRLVAVSDGTIVVVDGTAVLADLGTGSCPDWSPDGQRVVFASAGSVWTVAADGSGIPIHQADGLNAACPRWSPDGEWIAYTAESGNTLLPEIFVVGVDGGEPYQLTFLGVGPGAVWVPAGAPLE